MQVTVSGHHVQVSDRIKDYLNTRLQKVKRHSSHITITKINIILSIDNGKHRAEAIAQASGHQIVARENAVDFYTAIDGLVDKLDRQVIRHKEKMNNHRSHM